MTLPVKQAVKAHAANVLRVKTAQAARKATALTLMQTLQKTAQPSP